MKFNTRSLPCSRTASDHHQLSSWQALRRPALCILALLTLLSLGLPAPLAGAGGPGAGAGAPSAPPIIAPSWLIAAAQDDVGPPTETGAQPPRSPGATPAPAYRSVPAYRQASNVVIITIQGEVDGVTTRSVARRLQEAKALNADAVVFEIDTFGGQAAAALEICQLIKDSPVPLTVAWIHPKAYSAGTFIALACHEIVVSPRAELGDAAPVLPGLIPIPDAERAKIESPFLAEVVESARMGGKYDERLVMSFVAVDMELWFIEHVETGERRFVDRTEYIKIFGEEPPDTGRIQASGGLPGAPADSEPGPQGSGENADELPPAPVGGQPAGPGGGRIGKYFGGPVMPSPLEQEGLSAEDRDRLIEQQQTLPSQRPVFTEADRGQWRLLEPVVDKNTLLTLSAPQALRYGIATATILNDQELMAYFGSTQTPIRLNQSWSESLVQVLTSMPVRIVLLILFLIGLLWELTTPGIGAPGTMAAIALVILLGAPALAGLAGWWEVMFVIVGIGLIAVELFVLPGFGVIGGAGLLMLGVGFIGSFVSPDPGGGILATSEQSQRELMQGLVTLILGLFGLGVAAWFGARHIERLPMFSKLVLTNSLADDDDRITRSPASLRESAGGDPLIAAMAPASGAALRPVVGDVGVALTTLRPVGRAEINGEVYDVEAGRGTIDPQTPIRVHKVDRFRIVVEEDRRTT